MRMNACWQECKRCLWITISQWSKKLDLPLMLSSVSTVINQLHSFGFPFWIHRNITLLTNVSLHHLELNAGTAGVWRIAAINEAGGWKDRTTVEDMDLAVRASLRGWKFVYLGDLQVLFPQMNSINAAFLYHILLMMAIFYLWILTVGEKWASQYFESLPIPTAQMVLWSC